MRIIVNINDYDWQNQKYINLEDFHKFPKMSTMM